MKQAIFAFLLFCLLANCTGSSSPAAPSSHRLATVTGADSVLFSFVFVGCNRIDHRDRKVPGITDGSMANKAVLKWIFDEVLTLKRKPEQFFFLGDMVLGESTTQNLDNQLQAWVDLYQNTQFSQISSSGIEMVAVPGNHEMLYANPNGREYPLAGTTSVWLDHMSPFMPADRDTVTGGGDYSQMTFAFKRHNVGFIVMNTDTYNAPTNTNPNGLEGIVDTQWIIQKIKQYRADTSIDHIFVLGHKPCYVNGQIETGHSGLPEGPILWPVLNQNQVSAMLSAHVHDYQRMQPGNKGSYQIIAGNGGSSGQAAFYGFSLITVYKNGTIELKSIGFDKGNPYYTMPAGATASVRDSTILSWGPNANPY